MLKKEWKALKSGTDIRGVAVEGVEGSVQLTDEAVERLAMGFAVWLDRTVNHTEPLVVSVGRDSRISGERIASAVIRTLQKAGFVVKDCGLASTPAMFMTTVDLGCSGAVQITASHHPYHRNGLKFFTRAGGLEGADIEQILQLAQDGDSLCPGQPGTAEAVNYMNTYCERLRNLICEKINDVDYARPLRGYHIVVDAGNGVGGFYAGKVLEPLGADVSGSQFLEPDGMFPNHIPNPENEQAMESIAKAVREHHADLGVIFDTDVDRAGCVDRSGKELNRNRLVALASCIALENCEGGTIVTDSITSSGLKTFIEADLKGRHHRFKRGYKNVIDEATRINNEGGNAPLAIETSGHAALRENYFLDDGAYLMTRIIIKMAQLGRENLHLEDLIANLKEPLESVEIRMELTQEDFHACGSLVLERLAAYAQEQENWQIAPDNREGIRVSFGPEDGDGWFLLRLSVHDPIMPLNIESDSPGGVRIIAGKLLSVVEGQAGLDTSPLSAFLSQVDQKGEHA